MWIAACAWMAFAWAAMGILVACRGVVCLTWYISERQEMKRKKRRMQLREPNAHFRAGLSPRRELITFLADALWLQRPIDYPWYYFAGHAGGCEGKTSMVVVCRCTQSPSGAFIKPGIAAAPVNPIHVCRLERVTAFAHRNKRVPVFAGQCSRCYSIIWWIPPAEQKPLNRRITYLGERQETTARRYDLSQWPPRIPTKD